MNFIKMTWKTAGCEMRRFFAHCPVFTPVRYLFKKKKLREKAIQTIDELGRPFSEELCRDMIWKCCAHQIAMREYFHFDCGDSSYREIEEYIGTREKGYWIWKMNRFSNGEVFGNKYKTYCRLRQYYKREVIRIQSEEDFPEFCRLLLSCGRLVIKPVSSSFGYGVHLINADTERKAKAIFNQFLRYPDGFIAEEPIRQSTALAELHPQSVNTVRMMTIRHHDYVRIWHPFLRIGRGESIVDNAMAGGIECIISPDSGILEEACDLDGNSYEKLQDTGKALKGFQIPRWDEAIALAKELAAIFPQSPFIGWDLALTDRGWVVIEGNLYPGMSFQGIKKVGLKKEFKREIKEIRQGK